jgi:hypothetical protein
MYGFQNFASIGTMVAHGSFGWPFASLMTTLACGAVVLAAAAGTGMGLSHLRTLSVRYVSAGRRTVGAPATVSRLATAGAAR